MKFTKLALACALGLAGIHQASADVEIHIVGSTAFRAATVNSIINRLGSPVGIYTDDGSSISGSNNCVITGTYTGVTGNVIVRCAWSGSVAGIQAVTGGANIKFLVGGNNSGGTAVTASAVTVSGSVASGGGAIHTVTSQTAAIQPEITMADNYQSSTLYTSPHLGNDNIVGIIPFALVSSQNAPADVTNIGPNAMKAMWTSGGYLSAEVLSGNTADHASFGGTDGTLMYAIGRDNGSGTRVNCFAESGIGIQTAVFQFTPNATITGVAITNNTVTDITLDTRGLNGSTVNAGFGGESSGGSLADVTRYNTLLGNSGAGVTDDANSNSPRPVAFITYLGESDSYRATAGNGSGVTGTNAGNAHYLTYNGVGAFGGIFFNDVVSTTSGNTTLSAAGSTSPSTAFVGVVAGQYLRGANIAADAVVVSVNTGANPNTLVMSIAATGTSTTAKATVNNLLPTPFRLGTYTFWGYEHIMWGTFVTDTFGTAADKSTVANAVKTQIATGGYQSGVVNASNKGDYYAAGLANDSAMTVGRSSDGGGVVAKY